MITDEVAMRTVYALFPAYASTELLQDAPLLRLLAEVVSNASDTLKKRNIVLRLIEPAVDLQTAGLSDGLSLMRIYCNLSDCLVSFGPVQIHYPSPLIDFMCSTAQEYGLPIIEAAHVLDDTDDIHSLVDAIEAVVPDTAIASRTPLTPALLSRVLTIDPELDLLLNSRLLAGSSATRVARDPGKGKERIGFSRVPGSFAHEMSSVDCASLTVEAIAVIREHLHEHKLLVFRNQELTPDDQIKFTMLFGRPDMAWDNRNRSDIEPRIQVITNQYKGGEYHYDRSRRMSTVRYWHADTSFLANPTRYTFLSIHKVPAKYGLSEFINTKLAYAALPTHLREAARGKLVCHSFNYIFGDLLKMRKDERSDSVPDVIHPLVWRSRHGDSLYLSELSQSHVVGLTKYESDKLITQLMEHCKLPRFRHTHVWREGDFLVWDNIGIMHRGGFADPDYERVLHRTTVTVEDARATDSLSAAGRPVAKDMSNEEE